MQLKYIILTIYKIHIKMDHDIIDTPNTILEENNKILESRKYNLFLIDEEYELTMNLYELFIEFILTPLKIISPFYYKEKFDLESINKNLFAFFKELKEAFIFYDDTIKKKKVNLIKQKISNIINLNMKNINLLNEEVNTNLELKQIKLKNDDLIIVLLNEINELKNKVNEKNEKEKQIEKERKKENDVLINSINNKMKEYVDKKINELNKDNKKIFDEKINELNKDNKENKKIFAEKINELKKDQEIKINDIKEQYEEKIKTLTNEHTSKIASLKNEQNELHNEFKKLNLAHAKLKTYIDLKINEIKKEQNSHMNILKKSEKLFINNIELKKMEQKISPLLHEKKEKFNMDDDNNDLINNFKCENISNLKNINTIPTYSSITWTKSVAVYTIIKNNEKKYELAYPDNNIGYNIIIYDLLLNKASDKIYGAHSNSIHSIKHYYYSYVKKHLLLTSSADNSIKLWNISSNPILNELLIKNCFDGDKQSPFCALFNRGDYYILGGSRNDKKNIWNKNGVFISPIVKSQLKYGRYIESAYINNKPYVLLGGNNHSESYDFNNDNLKIYQSNKNKSSVDTINLLNKKEITYLMSGDKDGNIIIFDFNNTNEIYFIPAGNDIYALCSLNEKYFLVGNKELKVIDFDNKLIVKNYAQHNNWIRGIEKINIEHKGEFIISYDRNEIKIWK